MNFGYFDDAKREYVITDPRTPVKWINYIGTLDFGGFVDHTGGAVICRQDPALNRITKYIAQMPDSDFKAETLYLRIRQPDGFRVLSPFFVPGLEPLQHFECHVGLGYTRIISELHGVRTDATIFVPPGKCCEIRDIRITNLSDATQEVDVVPVVEYTHPDALKQLTNADWVPQTMVSRAVDQPGGLLVLLEYPFMLRDTRVNYFTSNHPVASFDTDRRRFLGDNASGSWARPAALQQPELSNWQAWRADNIAALLHHLGPVRPGESRRVITQLGQAENLAAAMPAIARFRDERNVDAALQELAQSWDRYLAHLQVETPDTDLNRLVNVHNPRQCYITMNWSRYLSLYQLGYGARGIGFRDSAQDVLGVLTGAPAEALALTRKLLQTQKRDGSAMHQFNPLTLQATEGDARERPDLPQYYSDDHLWIVLAVSAYVKETGDAAFLQQVVPYYEKGADGAALESGTVLDHLRRALTFTRGDVGQHGLPLLGFADWNDTVNLRRGAESMFTANLYGKALREMMDLCAHLGAAPSAQEYAADHAEMSRRVNACAWDGDWYISYFDSDGTPLGSQANAFGQIYSNGQSWPVISGFAPSERAQAALDSLRARLNTRNGIKLSAPSFNGFDPLRGGITTYPPGAKENGGIFLHTNPWVIIAETLLGHGDRAYEYYAQINPLAKNERIEEYECEPYVFAQNILGDEHPQFGLARNSWLTGTAAWAYVAATQYILGIRPGFAGLEIDPCIPQAWNGFSARRAFRGAVYHITVENPNHVCRGVRQMQVDGRAVAANVAPAFADGRDHQVHAILGESGREGGDPHGG